MKLLFVNACIRGKDSRTYQLCKDYMEKFKAAKMNGEAAENWIIEEVNLNETEIQPLNKTRLEKRIKLSSAKKFDDPEFDLARQFIEADHILIGAPYWDLSFPAKLKMYIERCSVTGLTFIYSQEGIPSGQCRASSLSYLTTSGSPIRDFNFGYDYIKGVCALFGIEKTYFASAEELDIIGKDVQKIMEDAKDKITEIINAL